MSITYLVILFEGFLSFFMYLFSWNFYKNKADKGA
jgi:hypothetical protein